MTKKKRKGLYKLNKEAKVGDARIDIDMYAIEILVNDDSIAEAVSVIEWLIKEGTFNKEYLV